MSSCPTRTGRTPAVFVAAALLLSQVGCDSSPRSAAAGGNTAQPTVGDAAKRDARPLAQELLRLMDQTMSYASSHRGNLPGSLRLLGVDSLTPTTARYLQVTGRRPLIVVVYRDPRNRAVTSCRGTEEILEQSMLHDGRIDVICTLPTGEAVPMALGLRDGP